MVRGRNMRDLVGGAARAVREDYADYALWIGPSLTAEKVANGCLIGLHGV